MEGSAVPLFRKSLKFQRLLGPPLGTIAAFTVEIAGMVTGQA
jgi:hypothetical protein